MTELSMAFQLEWNRFNNNDLGADILSAPIFEIMDKG